LLRWVSADTSPVGSFPQEGSTKSRIELTIIVRNLFAFADGTTRNNVAIAPMRIGVVGVIHVVVMVASQQDFAIHPITVVPDIVPRRLRQFREFGGRVDSVEAFHETPDLRVFANDLSRKNTKTVNGAFIKVGFDKKHMGHLRTVNPRVANLSAIRVQAAEGAPAKFYAAGLRSVFSRLSR
jgi:hypothetical protein